MLTIMTTTTTITTMTTIINPESSVAAAMLAEWLSGASLTLSGLSMLAVACVLCSLQNLGTREKLQLKDRLQTRLALLDRLIADADREIARLQHLLQKKRGATTSEGMPPGPDIVALPRTRSDAGSNPASFPRDALIEEQRGIIGKLREAGYSVGQIARLIGRSEAEIRAVLQNDSEFPRRDAA